PVVNGGVDLLPARPARGAERPGHGDRQLLSADGCNRRVADNRRMAFDSHAGDDPGSPLLHNLNPEQLAAVTLPARPALILAGAGSGKTRVLTTRIAWLIQTGQLSPGGVMAVTFTNKAAKEMLTRLGAMLPVPVRGMWIGTFHGLCNRFLRAHWKLAALPQGF